MFINYFANNRRNSPINLNMARILLGVYALWKMGSYNLSDLTLWPQFTFFEHKHRYFLLFPDYIHYLPFIKILLIVPLILFIVGYRLRLTSFLSAFFMAHFVSFCNVVNNDKTSLMAIHLLLFYGLFSDEDKFPLGSRLKSSGDQQYTMNFLKWALVILASAYFFTGYGKVVHGPLLEWATAGNLARNIQLESLSKLNGLTPVGAFIVNHPAIALISSWMTVMFEYGFIFAVLFKRPIWFFVLGLLGMHTIILLTHEIFFFDNYLICAMFLPWDDLYEKYIVKADQNSHENNLYLAR